MNNSNSMKKRINFFLFLLTLFILTVQFNISQGAPTDIYFISADGDLAICYFQGNQLNISILSNGKSIVREYLPLVISDSGAKYENHVVMFWNKGYEATVQINGSAEKRFVLADKYYGSYSAIGGDISALSWNITDYYFSNAVEVIYVVMIGDTLLHGNWYLLKGEPLKDDPPDYNTTLFELLKPDKSDFHCFLQEPGNPNKLIMLMRKCDVNTPSEYILLRE